MKNIEMVSEEIKNIIEFLNNNGELLKKHYYSIMDINFNNEQRLLDNEIYENIDDRDYSIALLSVSTVVLTANMFECEILNYNISKEYNVKIKRLIGGLNIFKNSKFRTVNAFLFRVNGYTVLHLNTTETGSNTPYGSTDLVRYIENNRYLYPSCIISFGICYGVDCKKTSLCETIIAEKIYPCSVAIKTDEEKHYKVKSDDYILDLSLCGQKSAAILKGVNDILIGRKNDAKGVYYTKFQTGNMLSGEAVVNNVQIRDEQVDNSYGCNIIGGEMEGYGLVKECTYYYHIPCLIIKAICDWGVAKNIEEYLGDNIIDNDLKSHTKDKIQALAAYSAYTVLNKLFCEKVLPSENLCANLQNYIVKTYCSEGSIPTNYLKKTIFNFLKNNTTYSSFLDNISKNLKDEIDFLFESCLLHPKIVESMHDENFIACDGYFWINNAF